MSNEYKFIARIGQHDIECRAFTLREYKDLLQAKLEGRMEDEILSLFKKCTNAPEMSKHEGELLLINLWANSIGEVNVERTWECACGKEIPIPINLMHASVDVTEDLLYSFSEFKVKFRYPSLFQDKNKAQMVAECIEYIVIPDGSTLSVEELSDNEIEDLYAAITTEDIERISAMLTRPQIQLAVPISCECGESHVHIIKGLKEFFKVL